MTDKKYTSLKWEYFMLIDLSGILHLSSAKVYNTPWINPYFGSLVSFRASGVSSPFFPLKIGYFCFIIPTIFFQTFFDTNYVPCRKTQNGVDIIVCRYHNKHISFIYYWMAKKYFVSLNRLLFHVNLVSWLKCPYFHRFSYFIPLFDIQKYLMCISF